MRKLAILLVALIVAMTAQSQAIKSGMNFFDGVTYYTVKDVRPGGIVYMTGTTADGGWAELTLKAKAGASGVYTLEPSVEADYAPFGAEFGWEVRYETGGEPRFLSVRTPVGDVAWILQQTALGKERSFDKQNELRSLPVGDVVSQGRLLNRDYLSRYEPEELRLMRNEIMARHGYNFSSTDLKAYFESQPWYRPCADNTAIKLNSTELANVQLIRCFENQIAAEEPEYEDTPGVTEGGREVSYVSNEVDFIASLKSNTIIEINAGTRLNLTKILNRQDFFELGDMRLYTGDYAGPAESGEPYVVSNNVGEGRELVLLNLKNVTIRGGKDVEIVVEPHHANVLKLVNCENVAIDNVTMGHQESGYCEGNVIYMSDCSVVSIKHCDLYGCGAYGLQCWRSHGVSMEQSIIRDCTYGIMELYGCTGCTFEDCEFIRNKEYNLVYVSEECADISFSLCRFAENRGVLFDFRTPVVMQSCEIHHGDVAKFGSTELIITNGADNLLLEDDLPLLQREVGPK